MKTFKPMLEEIAGDRVLDVATGTGGFVQSLQEDLASYTEIIGIDTSERARSGFAQSFQDPRIHFLTMDAGAMSFPDGSFDTVAVSFSLHHFTNPMHVLREMKRVLRAGGHFIVSEMYRDNQAETQMTHVLLHDWWGAIDTARGVFHNRTYTRQQILSILDSLELPGLETGDLIDLDEDPLDPENLERLDEGIRRYIDERCAGLSDQQALRDRGEALHRRLHQIGIHGASVLVAVARKLAAGLPADP